MLPYGAGTMTKLGEKRKELGVFLGLHDLRIKARSTPCYWIHRTPFVKPGIILRLGMAFTSLHGAPKPHVTHTCDFSCH